MIMIKHKKRIKQVLDFKGIGDSKIHPSDIDAILEFDNQFLIIFECKLKGVSPSLGQKMLFRRIADAWQNQNGEAFVVYCEHQTRSSDIINMKNSIVIKVYHRGKYHERNENIKDFLIKLADNYNIKKLKNSL